MRDFGTETVRSTDIKITFEHSGTSYVSLICVFASYELGALLLCFISAVIVLPHVRPSV